MKQNKRDFEKEICDVYQYFKKQFLHDGQINKDVKKQKTVNEILEDNAEMFLKKQKEYGDTYYQWGEVLQSLFPKGLTIQTVEDWNKYGLLFFIIHKLTRIIATGLESIDSVKDLSIYAAMLQEMLEKYKIGRK